MLDSVLMLAITPEFATGVIPLSRDALRPPLQ